VRAKCGHDPLAVDNRQGGQRRDGEAGLGDVSRPSHRRPAVRWSDTRVGTLGTLCSHSTRTVGQLGDDSACSRQQPTLATARDPCSGSPVHVVDFDRYRLRLSLECPLVGIEERTRRAFDVYFAELVRDDETICATAEVYFVRIDDPGVDHAHAAVAISSEFLVKVCREALDRRGFLRECVEQVFADALTEVFVLDRIQILNPDADKPVLRGMFAQAIFSTLSRGMDILFVNTTPGELTFWHDTIGARPVGDFVVASGARRLPTYPSPPRPPRRTGRASPPRLRVLGKPRESN